MEADVLIRYNKLIESTKAVIGKKCCRSLKPEFDLRIDTEICDSSRNLKFYIEALIDCGATDSFIDQDLVDEKEIPIKPLWKPIPIYQSDGEQTSAGDVTGYVEVKMRIRDHNEHIKFYVTKLGKRDIFLGYTWLRKHNPEINWVTKRVSLTRCPSEACGPRERAVSTPEQGNLMPHDPDTAVSANKEREEEHVPRDILALIRATGTKATDIAAASQKKTEPLPEWVLDYKEVFEPGGFDELPPRRPWDHAIDLKEGTGPWTGTRIIPLSSKEQETMKDFLAENLKTGRIRPSKSPYASPFFFGKKKDGKLRPIQDYRKLNAITVPNKTPLPLIKEVIDRLNGAKVFSKMDIRWGFNNVRIKEGDEEKAAFVTSEGLFEPTVMFFGLTNSPATFQTMMNAILQPVILEGHVQVYIDDILVYTSTKEEHRTLVRRVLQILKENRLFLKPEKCEFEKDHVDYLGVVVSANGVAMDHEKVKAIADWPIPKKLVHVQEFIGFLNFYRRFIEGFSQIARPLHDLTKKDAAFTWTDECQRAFEELKSRVTSAPILAMARDEGLMRIEADACQTATGAVLSQEQDGVFRPIAYFSQSLNPTERNYDIYDRELLGIMKALKEWRHYVIGRKFEIWTDHKNLEYFMEKRDLNRRQARWSAELADFEYTLHYKTGKSMVKANVLSRRPDLAEGVENDNKQIQLLPTFQESRKLAGTILRTQGDVFVEEIKNGVSDYGWKTVQMLKESMKGTKKASDGATWHKEDGIVTRDGAVVVPKDRELKRRIISAHHDSITAGHPGEHKTTELVRRDYHWEGMTHDIKTYVNACPTCPKIKPSRQQPMGELQPTEIPEQPWKIITMDFIGPLPESRGNDMILNVVDRHSKLLYSLPCRSNITAEGVARLFQKEIWPHKGLPRQVITDRGPQFVAAFTRELYKLLRITRAPSTAYHPQTDGQTERVNQEIEIYLRAFINHHQDNWEDWLPAATFSWNSKPGPTGRSPFEATKGYQPTMGMEPSWKGKERAGDFVAEMAGVFKETEAALKMAAEDMKRFYDRGRRPDDLKIGDKVWLDTRDLRTDRPSKKFDYKRVGPFEIIEKHGRMAYKLKLPSTYKVHPVFPAVKLTKAKDDEWKRPLPKIKLKVRDPETGEFINSTELAPEGAIRMSEEDFENLPWRLNPDAYPQARTTQFEPGPSGRRNLLGG